MARYRNCVFTHNNPTEALVFNEEIMLYLIYQEEISESGTYHFQGYCEFVNQMSLNPAKNWLGGPEVHLEPRRGSQQQAIEYCKKEASRVDGPHEFGQPRSQGKRMDLEAFKDEVMSGKKRKRELLDDHCGVIARYPKFYDTLCMMNMPTREKELEVTLLYGDTGTGKTRFVFDNYGKEDLYITPLNNGTMWWDGYDQHKVVLMDDFSGAACHMTLVTLLRLLDRYPVQAPVKGAFTWWLPEKIFITTNILPKDWFKWLNRLEQYKALARRITRVIVYKRGEEPAEQPATWWDDNSPGYVDIQN